MKKSLIALLAVGMFGTAVQAQAPTWSGFNAGLSLGSLNYTSTWTDTSYDWFGGSLSYSKRKIAPSIHVGWDTQIGSVVYGAEADYTFASAKRTEHYSASISNPASAVTKTDELKSITTLRGRMGLAVGDGLVYATAGFAKAKADHSWINRPTSNQLDNWTTFNNDHTGFVYGFGLEHRLNQMVSIRAEYQHVNIPEASSLNGFNDLMEVGESVNTFNFGASFHF